ncbi:hypothetical protein D3C78_439200 [compost metagenome]
MANDQGKSGQQGGTPQHNPDQVSNDPIKPWDTGHQGGQMPEDKWENDPQRSGGGTQQGATGGHGSGSRAGTDVEQGMDSDPQLDDEEDSGMNKDDR